MAKRFSSHLHAMRAVMALALTFLALGAVSADEAADKLLEEKLGRNDLCPCGSGKRFKTCCLSQGCF